MRTPNEQSLGQAIEAVFKRYNLQEKVDGIAVINAWEAVVGKMIASHTTDLYVHRSTLFVYLDSDAIRNELKYARELILKNLNQAAGKAVIKEIVLL